MTPVLEDTFVQTPHLRLHVVQAGPLDGPPVVLLHGFPEFWYGWRRQIPTLAQAGYRVIVPDQRGYNQSDKPLGVAQYAVHHLAADVIGLLDALGQKQVYLAGHDWGAAVAWETALRYPERVARLAILNVPHPDVMTRYLLIDARQALRSWYIFFFQIPGLPEWLLSRNRFVALRRMMQASAKPAAFTPADLERYVQAWGQPGALTAMLHWYRAAARSGARYGGRVLRRPRRVQPSTLVLWGEGDIALRAEMAWPSVDLCRDGRLVTFPQATHWVQHDEAEAVSRQLLQFFA